MIFLSDHIVFCLSLSFQQLNIKNLTDDVVREPFFFFFFFDCLPYFSPLSIHLHLLTTSHTVRVFSASQGSSLSLVSSALRVGLLTLVMLMHCMPLGHMLSIIPNISHSRGFSSLSLFDIENKQSIRDAFKGLYNNN